MNFVAFCNEMNVEFSNNLRRIFSKSSATCNGSMKLGIFEYY